MTGSGPALAGEICFYMKVTVFQSEKNLINVVDDLSIKGKLIPNFETNY